MKARELFVAPKHNERMLPIRQLDLAHCIPVKVDHKTIIYVRPGTDIKKIKAKYSIT